MQFAVEISAQNWHTARNLESELHKNLLFISVVTWTIIILLDRKMLYDQKFQCTGKCTYVADNIKLLIIIL